ncbi:hypothetical protein [Mesobacterium pallidum]|uniref:hypothetical protein n=1 Tax=Mesobacterium pallidum TaxID=2872037 RepID=UPI001EE1AB7C|nr:hypothetical protein [Mesobacterium pallidum]
MFEDEHEPEFEDSSSQPFNALKAITFLFFLAFAAINPTEQTGKVYPKAEILIPVNRAGNNPDDVDTYVAVRRATWSGTTGARRG